MCSSLQYIAWNIIPVLLTELLNETNPKTNPFEQSMLSSSGLRVVFKQLGHHPSIQDLGILKLLPLFPGTTWYHATFL